MSTFQFDPYLIATDHKNLMQQYNRYKEENWLEQALSKSTHAEQELLEELVTMGLTSDTCLLAPVILDISRFFFPSVRSESTHIVYLSQVCPNNQISDSPLLGFNSRWGIGQFKIATIDDIVAYCSQHVPWLPTHNQSKKSTYD